MCLEILALQFVNLLEIANISAVNGQGYEHQKELIKLFRERKQPFLATMPLRHRFRCEICRVERGESIYHFENPDIAIESSEKDVMWGPPAGIWVQIETKELHNVLAHNAEPNIMLKQVLESVSC